MPASSTGISAVQFLRVIILAIPPAREGRMVRYYEFSIAGLAGEDSGRILAR
jgi:hypothetical protein